jgi:hypothetical protein
MICHCPIRDSMHRYASRAKEVATLKSSVDALANGSMRV